MAKIIKKIVRYHFTSARVWNMGNILLSCKEITLVQL